MPTTLPKHSEWIAIAVLLLVALLARSLGHGTSPLGWRDDELSNALVISQHVRDGDLRVYYDDASGHEGLYHWLQAITMAAFGPSVWGIRGVSILAGTAAVALTYWLTRQMFHTNVALFSAGVLALSFWALMYSRSGQRHVLVTVTTLLAFSLYWAATQQRETQARYAFFAGAGAAMGMGFYTYFASRGVPLIPLAWVAYLAIWNVDRFRQVWKGTALTLGVAAICAIPLIVTLQQQPEAEARVAELAKPIYDARDGDFSTLVDYTVTTLSMFTHDGDDEALYNIPHRPIFSPVGGILFWMGILLALVSTFGPQRDDRTAFLLLWLGAGLAPGVLSVPAASLGHTILAQTPTMIIMGLAAWQLVAWLTTHTQIRQVGGAAILAALLILEGGRDIYAYWWVWPQNGFTRVHHHSDLYEAAEWLNTHATETRALAVGGYLTERWDQEAVRITLDEEWQVRVFDPRSAVLFMGEAGYIAVPEYLSEGWGVNTLTSDDLLAHSPWLAAYTPSDASPIIPLAQFTNGLRLNDVQVTVETDNVILLSEWYVPDGIDLPPRPLLSKPPAPDEDDTPRLWVFHQVVGEDGVFIAGRDLLSVDPYTLYSGDRFIQRAELPVAIDRYPEVQIIIGLYDPQTGDRIPMENGDTSLVIPVD